MKNVAYVTPLVASFALGCFGAFVVYHGTELPTPAGMSMNTPTAIGLLWMLAGGTCGIYTCAYAITHPNEDL